MSIDSVTDIVASESAVTTLPEPHGGEAGQGLASRALKRHRADRTRLLDMLWDVQRGHGYISAEAVEVFAKGLNLSPYDVRETASFYHFFHDRPGGRYRIYLCDSVTAKMSGHAEVIFLLEMGMAAASRLREFMRVGGRMLAFGVLVPLFNGTLVALVGTLVGLSLGSAFVLACAAASASYIDAPAAVRATFPEANPSIYLTSSVGVTLPFMLVLGIPLLYGVTVWWQALLG